MPNMSLTTTPSSHKPAVRHRLERKLKQALDNMAMEGMHWNEAARAANYSTASMWRALQSSHAQAYLRQQRQVFRASLVDEATHRMRALSKQDGNVNAAVAATAKLMSESDQEHSHARAQHAPGLVVQIINSPSLPNASPVRVISGHAIDVAAQSTDDPPDCQTDG